MSPFYKIKHNQPQHDFDPGKHWEVLVKIGE